jgi:hypothetical protein
MESGEIACELFYPLNAVQWILQHGIAKKNVMAMPE